jgi:diphthine-ammonia ligase
MEFIALISGGKDSILSAILSVKKGHKLIAMANLYPTGSVEDSDSFMYQTIGHSAVPLLAQAAGLPIFRKKIEGAAVCSSKSYTPIDNDEVEDMFRLLVEVKVRPV